LVWGGYTIASKRKIVVRGWNLLITGGSCQTYGFSRGSKTGGFFTTHGKQERRWKKGKSRYGGARLDELSRKKQEGWVTTILIEKGPVHKLAGNKEPSGQGFEKGCEAKGSRYSGWARGRSRRRNGLLRWVGLRGVQRGEEIRAGDQNLWS